MTSMSITTLAGKPKKRWTLFFVVAVIGIVFSCLAVMNHHYDSLARYPYRDQKSRELIKQYLNEEEIAYIIEYSIPPNMFIAFIQEPGFSIYHAAEYKKLSQTMWQETPRHIVEMVEQTRAYIDVDTLIHEITDGNYTYDVLADWLQHGDVYAPQADLLAEPSRSDAFLDGETTIAKRVPPDLILLEDALPHAKALWISKTIQEPLAALCRAIGKEEASVDAFGGLSIERGYVSYEQQAELSAPLYAPGQDERQLGTSVDVAVAGIADDAFAKTWQADWLREHAWEYGFVVDREDEPYHLRYIGYILAQTLHDDRMTFRQYAMEQAHEERVITR